MVPTQIDRTGGSTEFIVVRAREHVLDKFVFLAVTHQPTHQRAIALMTGTTGRQRVSGSDLAELSINLPPLPEQHRIVDLMGAVDAYVAAADARVEAALVARTVLLISEFSRLEESYPRKSLAELCEIQRGGSPRPIDKFMTRDPSGINWIKISDATASTKYIFETADRIIPAGVKSSREVYEGDLLLSNSMSFGRPYILKTSGCIHDGWLTLRIRDGVLDPEFLFYVLDSRPVFNAFDRLAAGSGVRNLNIDLVGTVKVPAPSLESQRKVIDLMSAADTEVAAAATTAAAARTLRTALLSDLLSGNHEIPASYDRFVEAA